MVSRRRPAAMSFVERHGLWTGEQARQAKDAAQAIKKNKLELVRFSFADQHGVLRGKTLLAADALAAMASGVTMTTTLLAKDTAHKTVYPVFTAGGGFGMAEMQGGGDFLMVADPATFRVLPWAPNTGWLLCDIFFADGRPVPFSTRQILRDALAKLAAAGFDFRAGLEVEFHLFKLENPRLAPEDATWPPCAPEVSLLNQGYQYLTETRFDQLDAALAPIWRGVAALGMPLRSLEVELGPSQCEFTFRPQTGLAAADTMVLFRAAAKQIARRHGLFASFMCRPALPNLFSSGWHLHQSLLERGRKVNAFAGGERDGLSAAGVHFLGGLLAHAHAAAAFTTPTVNGYKRYRPYTLAPDRAIWARDNRGVMVRVLGAGGEPRRRAGGQSLSLQRRADPRRPRRHRAPPRSRPVGRHALRDRGAGAAEKSRRSARRAARRRDFQQRLRRGLHRLLHAPQRSGVRALHRRSRRRDGGRRHRLGAERIFRFVLTAPSPLVGGAGEGVVR
jgi:glutamine synthetase